MKDYNKIDRRLGTYSLALLYIFIGLLVVQTLFVRINPDVYVKESVVQDPQCSPNCDVPDNDYGYERISEERINDLKRKKLYFNIFGFLGILGWCFFNPDFRKGLKDKLDWIKKQGL